MRTDATDGKEGGESNDELRARWEGANYRMVVCANGVVNVENRNYNEPGHIYSVRVENGAAVGCSCPHAVRRGAHCKHQVAVENRPLVVSSAAAASTSYASLATDGGHDDHDDDDRDESGRVRPTRSEPADFGGGPSGVDEL